jgi:hypothetical protein
VKEELQSFSKREKKHRKPRDNLNGHLLETQEKECAKDQKYQALKTSKVKERATMKRIL